MKKNCIAFLDRWYFISFGMFSIPKAVAGVLKQTAKSRHKSKMVEKEPLNCYENKLTREARWIQAYISVCTYLIVRLLGHWLILFLPRPNDTQKKEANEPKKKK